MAGMDHGHDGAAGGTAEGWDAVRMSALEGYLPPEDVEAFRQVNIDYVSEQLRTRSEFLKGLPEAEREQRIAEFAPWTVDNALKGENGASTEGDAGMHTHGPTEWIPLESAADQQALQQQLREAGTVIPQFPTSADAVAGGYRQVTPYVPGIGAHYLNITRLTDGKFIPSEPEMLLYNGNDPESELVGLSYGMLDGEVPEGFVGRERHVAPAPEPVPGRRLLRRRAGPHARGHVRLGRRREGHRRRDADGAPLAGAGVGVAVGPLQRREPQPQHGHDRRRPLTVA